MQWFFKGNKLLTKGRLAGADLQWAVHPMPSRAATHPGAVIHAKGGLISRIERKEEITLFVLI